MTQQHMFMQTSDLHWTATVTEGADTKNKKNVISWLVTGCIGILKCVHWLLYQIAKFFNVRNLSPPHVSLARTHDVQWKDLELWVTRWPRLFMGG